MKTKEKATAHKNKQIKCICYMQKNQQVALCVYEWDAMYSVISYIHINQMSLKHLNQ